MHKAIPLTVALLLFLAPVGGAQARSSNGPASGLAAGTYSANVYRIVEEQSDAPFSAGNPRYVLNNSGCPWTGDDNGYATLTGSLGAGSRYAANYCRIAAPQGVYTCRSGTCATWGYDVNSAAVDITAPSQNLVASLCWSDGGCFAPYSIALNASGLYEYRICVTTRYYASDPAVIPISDSGTGGIGVPETITVSVVNPTSKTVRNVAVEYGIVNSGNNPAQSYAHVNVGCPANGANGAPNANYPFWWY